MSYLTAVDINGGLDMRALQEESDLPMAPALGNTDGATVSSFACEVLAGGEEEGEGHIAGVAVGLHEGVEVVAAVVERACPAGVHREVVTEAVGKERTGEGDGGGVEAGAKVPGAGEV